MPKNNEPKTIKYIIIAGGSYAPVHKGHLNNWISAIDHLYNIKSQEDKELKVEDILLLVIPVNDYSEKDSIGSVTYQNRLNLIELMLHSFTGDGDYSKCQFKPDRYNIKISDFHRNIKEVVYTYQEVNYVKSVYNIYPVILFGADNMIGAIGEGWNLPFDRMKQLFHENTFMCSCSCNKYDQRGHCEILEKNFDKVMKKNGLSSKLIMFKIQSNDSEISSTKIRNLFLENKMTNIRRYIYQNQVVYILKNRLWL